MKSQGLNYFIWLCSILVYHGCISFLLHFLHGIEKFPLSLIFPISFGVITTFSNYSNSSLKCLLVNISDDQTESFLAILFLDGLCFAALYLILATFWVSCTVFRLELHCFFGLESPFTRSYVFSMFRLLPCFTE